MSVSLMDGGFHMNRTWRSPEQSPPPSDPMRSVSHTIPGISRALSAPFPNAQGHRLAPISTSFETALLSHPDIDSPEYSQPQTASARNDPDEDTDERPEKRPRLFYDQGSERPETSGGKSAPHRPTSSSLEDPRLRVSGGQSESSFPQTQECLHCSDTHDIVASIVSGLIGLESDIRRALSLAESAHSTGERKFDVLRHGLKQSLMWASQRISSNSHMIREAPVVREGLPPSKQPVANLDRPSQAPQSGITSAPGERFIGSSERFAKDRVEETSNPSSSIISQDHPLRSFDTLPHILPPDAMKNRHTHEQGSRRGQSPHRSSSGSVLGSMPSPMQSQHSGRTLPSPSAFQYPPTPSNLAGTYSPTHSQSAQATHLQDLQHQISTKTLALQTLQREHDQLLAAFSRSQMRCNTLDKKSQVSDHEINTLTEEKIRLQQQVEALESQVEELVKARDEAQKQSSADGAQWRQIMAMSSQLQLKGTDDTKRYRADRDAWERDRSGLQQRIQELEAGKLTLMESGVSAASATSISSDDILASASLDVLREEIMRLRRSCAEMETALHDIKIDSDQKLDQAMSAISSIREQIKGKTRHGLHEYQSGS